MEPPNPNGIKAGDTVPLVVVLDDVNGPVNLTGATVEFRMKSKVAGAGHAAISGACVVVQTTDSGGVIHDRGKVSYSWAAAETDVPGVYGLEWVVTWATGKTRTFPNDRQITFEIFPAAA